MKHIIFESNDEVIMTVNSKEEAESKIKGEEDLFKLLFSIEDLRRNSVYSEW